MWCVRSRRVTSEQLRNRSGDSAILKAAKPSFAAYDARLQRYRRATAEARAIALVVGELCGFGVSASMTLEVIALRFRPCTMRWTNELAEQRSRRPKG
jgi:hypothetical protein